jgi:hypothetical protein
MGQIIVTAAPVAKGSTPYARRDPAGWPAKKSQRMVGKVSIRSAGRLRIVSIGPSFDPFATSMTPISGWTADGSPVGKAA